MLQVLQELEEQSRRLQQLAGERETLEQHLLALARETEQEQERQLSQRATDRERIRQGIEASLPAEIPAADPRPHLTAVLRMPDGTRSTRRCATYSVFLFVPSERIIHLNHVCLKVLRECWWTAQWHVHAERS